MVLEFRDDFCRTEFCAPFFVFYFLKPFESDGVCAKLGRVLERAVYWHVFFSPDVRILVDLTFSFLWLVDFW